LVGTSDGLKTRHRNVGQAGVGDKSQTSLESTGVANSCQVWRVDGCEVILVETEGAIHSGQRRNAERRDVSEGHVGSPDEVGEGNIQELPIGINVERGGDVRNLGAECLQSVVVVDVQGADSLQVDTIESAQESVGDQDIGGFGNNSREGKRRQSRQGRPRDVVGCLEVGHGEGGQECQVEQIEGFANRAD